MLFTKNPLVFLDKNKPRSYFSCILHYNEFFNCGIPHPDSLALKHTCDYGAWPEVSWRTQLLALFAAIHRGQTWPLWIPTNIYIYTHTYILGFPNLPMSHSSCPPWDGRPQGSSTDLLQLPSPAPHGRTPTLPSPPKSFWQGWPMFSLAHKSIIFQIRKAKPSSEDMDLHRPCSFYSWNP